MCTRDLRSGISFLLEKLKLNPTLSATRGSLQPAHDNQGYLGGFEFIEVIG